MKNIQKEIANIRTGDFAPVYLVLGEEKYFIERIREAIIEHALDEESIDLNFSTFDMGEFSISEALFEASSFPFFGDLLGFFGGFGFAPTSYFVSLS